MNINIMPIKKSKFSILYAAKHVKIKQAEIKAVLQVK